MYLISVQKVVLTNLVSYIFFAKLNIKESIVRNYVEKKCLSIVSWVWFVVWIRIMSQVVKMKHILIHWIVICVGQANGPVLVASQYNLVFSWVIWLRQTLRPDTWSTPLNLSSGNISARRGLFIYMCAYRGCYSIGVRSYLFWHENDNVKYIRETTLG